jgi:hypothetical protein
VKRSFLILAILATFSACGALPISIALDPANYSFGTTTPTAGNVMYPVSASAFAQSPVNVASVVVRGQASAASIGTPSVIAAIYGRTTDPSKDPNCTSFGALISCPTPSQTKLTNDLTLSSTKTGFEIGGDVIKQAVNSGKVWLGLEVKSGFSANLTLKLSEMIASVTLF